MMQTGEKQEFLCSICKRTNAIPNMSCQPLIVKRNACKGFAHDTYIRKGAMDWCQLPQSNFLTTEEMNLFLERRFPRISL